MLIAGNWGSTQFPATDLLVGLTLPQEPYRDSSQQQMDDFYQHLDHNSMILLSASIGEPGLIPGFPV